MTTYRLIAAIVLCLLFATVPTPAPAGVEAPASCRVCGMSRSSFDHSRMLIIYADRTSVGTCSLHCTAIVAKEVHGKEIKAIKTADFNTAKLFDAKTATWVIGSRQKGIMAPVTQFAFADEQDAQAFMKKYGGITVRFDKALRLAGMESQDGH